MVEMTTKMKTFKQHSKEEDKGYYINKDGVAVILEPVGNHKIDISKKKNIKESGKHSFEEGEPFKDILNKNGGSDLMQGGHHFKELHKKIAKNTGDVTKDTKEAIHNYSQGSYNLNNHLIQKHMVKHGKPVPKDHWKHLGQAKKDKNGNQTPYKENIDHWEKEHSHLMSGYRPAGTHTTLYSGVSARTSNAVHASKDGIISSPAHTSATLKPVVAQDFAQGKRKEQSPNVPHHYNVYHIQPHNKILHMQPHSDIQEEEEISIKPNSKWKHFKTTHHAHDSKLGGNHIFHHFTSHDND